MHRHMDQKQENEWKPVFCASRSLTATEQRYVQVEKEALAVTWNCDRFQDYLFGLSKFTTVTARPQSSVGTVENQAAG